MLNVIVTHYISNAGKLRHRIHTLYAARPLKPVTVCGFQQRHLNISALPGSALIFHETILGNTSRKRVYPAGICLSDNQDGLGVQSPER